MTLARVKGTVVASQRSDEIDGARYLLVEECDQSGSGRAEFLVALDTVAAAPGQLVLVAQGSSCRWTTATEERPIEALILAIVDQIDQLGQVVYEE